MAKLSGRQRCWVLVCAMLPMLLFFAHQHGVNLQHSYVMARLASAGIICQIVCELLGIHDVCIYGRDCMCYSLHSTVHVCVCVRAWVNGALGVYVCCMACVYVRASLHSHACVLCAREYAREGARVV